MCKINIVGQGTGTMVGLYYILKVREAIDFDKCYQPLIHLWRHSRGNAVMVLGTFLMQIFPAGHYCLPVEE